MRWQALALPARDRALEWKPPMPDEDELTPTERAGLPAAAAWRHRDARDGFEAAFFTLADAGIRIAGTTSAVEGGQAFSVEYDIELDGAWRTRRAQVRGRSARGDAAIVVTGDGRGRWHVDGVARPELDGCMDVDLESSAMTNALPVHRLDLRPGDDAEAPAVYVRALGLGTERLEQRYRCLDRDASGWRVAYDAPVFHVRCELRYDASGLVTTYPGLAERVL